MIEESHELSLNFIKEKLKKWFSKHSEAIIFFIIGVIVTVFLGNLVLVSDMYPSIQNLIVTNGAS